MRRKLFTVMALSVALLLFTILMSGCGGTDEKQETVKDTETKTETSTEKKEGTQEMDNQNDNAASGSVQYGPDGQPVKTLADFPQGQDGANVEAVIRTGKGDIVLQFHPAEAPVSVAAFIQRAREGAYNGTRFHRVVPGFVIQGGDPKSVDPNAPDVGTGGPGYYLPAEFSSLKHQAGTLAMARSKNVNSGGCQFYICLAPQQSLDGDYTVFGETVSGMEVVQQIAQGDLIKEIVIRPKSQ